jgi:hypothetical protein
VTAFTYSDAVEYYRDIVDRPIGDIHIEPRDCYGSLFKPASPKGRTSIFIRQ